MFLHTTYKHLTTYLLTYIAHLPAVYKYTTCHKNIHTAVMTTLSAAQGLETDQFSKAMSLYTGSFNGQI